MSLYPGVTFCTCRVLPWWLEFVGKLGCQNRSSCLEGIKYINDKTAPVSNQSNNVNSFRVTFWSGSPVASGVCEELLAHRILESTWIQGPPPGGGGGSGRIWPAAAYRLPSVPESGWPTPRPRCPPCPLVCLETLRGGGKIFLTAAGRRKFGHMTWIGCHVANWRATLTATSFGKRRVDLFNIKRLVHSLRT